MKLLRPYMSLPREVYVIFFSRIINAMGMFVHPLLTLILTVKIGLSIAQAGTIIAISGLVFLPSALIGGKLTDVVGRKKVIVVFDTLGSMSLLVSAFMEPSMNLVYVILAGGAMWGIGHPAHDALLSDITTPQNRTGAFSLSYLGFNLGFIVGPVIGGMLFENHLRLFFMIDAVTGFLATLLIIIFIKETIHLTDSKFDESRKAEEKVEGSIFQVLLKRPILIIFATLLFGYNFAYAQWGFLIPIHIGMLNTSGYAEIFGRLASFNGFVVLVFTPIITSLLEKISNLDRIIIGGILYMIGFGILGFFDATPVFVFSVFTFTLGEILITISFMPYVANHTPASHRGRMSSILPMIMGAGFSIGPFVMGRVVDLYSISFAWKMIGVIMIVSTLMMGVLNLYERKKLKNV
ncbi:MAG: MFS transporter [Clostridiales bacterium]|nr:MFS transporter [Clostridiales bacterium]